MWDVANANADERLIQELLGRQGKAGMLQYAQRKVEGIERAGKEMAQYVQTHCQGLSETACASKLQQSQDTAGVFTEIVAGFTPAGIAIDVKDLLQAETMGDYGLAVLGAVLPGLGDGFKAAIKGADAGPRMFRNLAPLDLIVPAVLFPAKQIQNVRYNGTLTYVVLASGELVIGRTPHTSLSRGRDVLAAGEARFVDGELRQINNASGHYKPSGENAKTSAESAFSGAGFDASGKYLERAF